MIESLYELDKQIHINYFEGHDIPILETLRKKYKILNIAFNKDYTPFAIKRDAEITEWCKQHEINIITAEDYTLFAIGSIKNKSGRPYQVFTPFYKETLHHTLRLNNIFPSQFCCLFKKLFAISFIKRQLSYTISIPNIHKSHGTHQSNLGNPTR